MKPTDFLMIHSGEPGAEGEPASGYSVRLGWIEGVPYITDLGSARPVLVNGTPIEPFAPCIIEAGDTITIANVHLTWKPGAGALRPMSEPAADQPQADVPPRPAPSAAEPAYSLLLKTAEESREIPLCENVLRIGRSKDNDLRVDDAQVSRSHALLLRHADGYEIVDLESAHGVIFEGARVPRKVLADGDVLWLSESTSLCFQVIWPPEEAAESPVDRSQDETVGLPLRPPAQPEAEEAEAQAKLPSSTHRELGARHTADSVSTEAGPGEPPIAQLEGETILAPASVTDTPAVERPSDTVVVPKRAAEKSSDTLVVPKKVSRQPDEGLEPPARAPERPEPSVDQQTAWIDMPVLLDAESELDLEAIGADRDTETPHLVVHAPDRTWEVYFTKDQLTIGRDEDSDITIQDDYVSRQHASVEREGDQFVIREVQSRNGVWLGRQRIDRHTLRDGDVLTVGRAKVIFKGGFKAEHLTLTDMPRIDGKPERSPVVFVPGMMGSELWLGSELLWPNLPLVASRPEVLSLPGDPRIEARKILDEVVVVPHILRLRKYSALGDYLESGLGYTRGKDLLEFAYDWRQDVRLAAQRLAEAIDNWQVDGPITIIAHSLGTLVTRYYVELFGGKSVVERIILMGGPHYGTPKGLAAILVGPGILPFGVGSARMREVLATFPSGYQILPVYPCVVGQDGTYIDALKDESWLPEQQRPFLRAARSFRRELGELSSVPCVSIFGYGHKTILRININRRPDGQWQEVGFSEEVAGDLSVPSGSAVLKESEIHPVMQEHGFLFVDDGVKMRLKVELTHSMT